MSLIDDTYFKDDIALPDGKHNPIQKYIDKYENPIIRELFGYQLGEEIINYAPETSSQLVKDIVEGKSYTVDNVDCRHYNPSGLPIQVKWNGLINSEKVSLIAYHVYYWWCRDNAGFLTEVGGVNSDLENAHNEGMNAKATRGWNSMHKLYGFEGQPIVIPSAYNFMYEHKESYPAWVFTLKGNINRFGL